jgi:hypothetical protein
LQVGGFFNQVALHCVTDLRLMYALARASSHTGAAVLICIAECSAMMDMHTQTRSCWCLFAFNCITHGCCRVLPSTVHDNLDARTQQHSYKPLLVMLLLFLLLPLHTSMLWQGR